MASILAEKLVENRNHIIFAGISKMRDYFVKWLMLVQYRVKIYLPKKEPKILFTADTKSSINKYNRVVSLFLKC